MRICIPSEGSDPSAEVDSMFGRARYFVIIDDTTKKHEFIDNCDNMDLESGAGTQAATQVVEKGVDCVVSGHIGPQALKILKEAGVHVWTGANGLVWDALEEFQDGELHQEEEPNIA